VKNRERGFTLLEIMIALAVLAMGMAAIMMSASQTSNNLAYMKDKTLAHWVAMNKLTELQLDKNWPGVGVKTGDYEMANRDWHWEVKVSDTEDKDVRRVDLDVYSGRDTDQSLAYVMGYLGRPL
jgi:general secretion pathway protein I